MKLQLASTALLSSATLLLLSIGPLCTAADASEAENIKVESAANQNGPDVASDLVCPLFSFIPSPPFHHHHHHNNRNVIYSDGDNNRNNLATSANIHVIAVWHPELSY